MKTTWWILIFIGVATFVHAQPKFGQERIDSLLKILDRSANADTSKVWLFIELSREYSVVNPSEGLRFAKEALELSDRLGWERGTMASQQMMSSNYTALTNYPMALEHTLKGLQLAERNNDTYYIAANHVSLGVIYLRMRDTTKSLDAYREALKSLEKIDDRRGLAITYNNIANILDDRKQSADALKYYEKALQMFEKEKNMYGTAMIKVNIGTVYQGQRAYTKALNFFFASLAEYRQLGANSGIAIVLNNIGEVYMKIAADSSGLPLPDSLRDRKSLLEKAERYSLMGFDLGKSMGAFDVMFNTSDHLSTIKELQGDPTKALFYYRQSVAYRDSVYNEENREKFEALARQREEDLKVKQIELQQLQLAKAKQRQNFLITGLMALVLFAGFIVYQNTRVRKAKDRSDDLLRNILPEETAEELKQTGHAAARQYDNVTVLFTDFKDFTNLATHLTPTELVSEIDYYYQAFDGIMEKYGIEKIKTIGDAYMAAGGLPIADTDNAYRVVKAALDIRDFVEREKEKRTSGEPHFDIRIGVNTGPVVAGIVGVKKFAYDIWGDTVNLASRMESSGEPGKVNISGSTYNLVKDYFVCRQRGKIMAKNKGEVEMYFVESEVKTPASV